MNDSRLHWPEEELHCPINACNWTNNKDDMEEIYGENKGSFANATCMKPITTNYERNYILEHECSGNNSTYCDFIRNNWVSDGGEGQFVPTINDSSKPSLSLLNKYNTV